MLNSVPNGPAKEWTQWRKTWVDIKKNIKTRFVKENKHARGTGGGPSLPPNVEAGWDQKILNIIPMVTIKGDDNVQESLVTFLDNDAILYEENKNANKENEQQTNIVTTHQNNYDHMYSCDNKSENAPTNSAPCSSQTAPSCSSQIYSTATKKRKRINKTSRLEESLKTNSRFIDVNEKKFFNDKSYQDKKISLMQTNLKNKLIFEDRVASALESMAESLGKIAT